MGRVGVDELSDVRLGAVYEKVAPDCGYYGAGEGAVKAYVLGGFWCAGSEEAEA